MKRAHFNGVPLIVIAACASSCVSSDSTPIVFGLSPCPTTYAYPVAFVGAAVRSKYQDASGAYDLHKLTVAVCTGSSDLTSKDLGATAQVVTNGNLTIDFDVVALEDNTSPTQINSQNFSPTYFLTVPSPLGQTPSVGPGVANFTVSDLSNPPYPAKGVCQSLGVAAQYTPADNVDLGICPVYPGGQGQRYLTTIPLTVGDSAPNDQSFTALSWTLSLSGYLTVTGPSGVPPDYGFQREGFTTTSWTAGLHGSYAAPQTPPSSHAHVLTVSPLPGATAGRGSQIRAYFGAPLDAKSLTSNSFVVTTSDGTVVAGSLSIENTLVAGDTLVFQPQNLLSRGAEYTAFIYSSLTGADGIPVAESTWSFQVAQDMPACDGSTTVGHPCTAGGVFAGSLGGYQYMTQADDGPSGDWGWPAVWALSQSNPTFAGVNMPAENQTNGAGYLAEGSPQSDLAGNTWTYWATPEPHMTDLYGWEVSGFALDYCANLQLGGFNDWYLPSIEELKLLYANRAQIGGFGQTYYWSSTLQGGTGNQSPLALDFTSGTSQPSANAWGGNFFPGPYAHCVRRYFPN